MVRACAALAVLVAAGAFAAEPRFALVIGSNLGWTDDPPLRFAESDARRVRDALVELGGVAPDHAVLLEDPDSASVRAALRKLGESARAAGPDAWVVFYFAGHSDGQNLHLPGAPLGLAEVLSTLSELPAAVRLALVDGPGAALGAPAPTNVVLVRARGADELSQRVLPFPGSAWSLYLTGGLRGAADLNGDGQVTFSEALAYAADSARRDVPTCSIDATGPAIERSWTVPVRSAAAMLFPPGPDARYGVVNEADVQLLAAARSAPSRALRVALPPGAYRVKRADPRGFSEAWITVKAGATASLEGAPFDPAASAGGWTPGSPTGDEVLAWRRREGLRLLAAGDPGGALTVFGGILQQWPQDHESRRAQARGLVRLAQGADLAQDRERERSWLAAAVEADPSLTEDPQFAPWYARLKVLDAEAKHSGEVKAAVDAELAANPRARRTWGLGLDLISTQGALAPWASAVLFNGKVFPRIGFDFFGFGGVGAEVRVVPLGWRLSPYLTVGVHTSWRGLGLFGDWTQGGEGYWEVWARMAHFDVGLEYFGTLGFMVGVGGGVMVYQAYDGTVGWSGTPNFTFGWFFPFSAASK